VAAAARRFTHRMTAAVTAEAFETGGFGPPIRYATTIAAAMP